MESTPLLLPEPSGDLQGVRAVAVCAVTKVRELPLRPHLPRCLGKTLILRRRRDGQSTHLPNKRSRLTATYATPDEECKEPPGITADVSNTNYPVGFLLVTMVVCWDGISQVQVLSREGRANRA